MIANIAALIFVSFGFGFSFVLIKFTEQTIPPLTLQSSRATIGFLSLLVLSIILKKDIKGHAKHWFAFLVFSILGIAYLWIVVGLGEEYVSAGLTAVLVSVTPLVTFIITVFIIRNEPFSITGFTGLLLGVLGLFLVIGISNIFKGGSTLTGVILIASGFAVFAVNGILAPRLSSGTDPIVATTYYTGMAVVIMWVFAFIFEKPLESTLTEIDLIAEIVMGVFCFAAAFVVYFWLLGRAGAFFSSISFYLVPIVGTLGSYFMLDEKMVTSQIAGMLIVFAGVYLINREKFK